MLVNRMLPHLFIESLNAPALEPYRTLRRPRDHERRGIFVAEGAIVVRRLLESTLDVVSFLLTPEWLTAFEEQIRRRPTAPEIFVAEKRLLEQIVGFPLHQGAMAVARVPAPVAVEDLIARSPGSLLLVALDGITNAENVGLVVRNCAAFGAHGVIVGETSSSPYLRRAVRNSMGTVFRVSVLGSGNLAQTLSDLARRFGVQTIAACPRGRGPTLDAFRVGPSSCIVFGSEGDGISPAVLEACTTHVAIPMANAVDSLNVASASAVFLYSATRARNSAQVPPAPEESSAKSA